MGKLPQKDAFNSYSLSIKATQGNWKDIPHAMRFLWVSLMNKKEGTLFIAPKKLNKSVRATRRVLSTVNDSLSWLGVEIVHDALVDSIALLDSTSEVTRKLLDPLKPEQMIAGQLRRGAPAVLAEVCKESHIPVTLLSHGSHAIPDTSVAEFEHQENAQGLLVSPLSDSTLFQSPHAEAYALKLGCTSGSRSRPIMWGTGKNSNHLSHTPVKTILHAGTYKQWIAPRPWIYETPDEFVTG